MKADTAAGIQPPPRPLPRLGPGLRTDQECAGVLAPQAVVHGQDAKGLLDDVIGPGAVLIGHASAVSGVTSRQRAELKAAGTRVVAIGETPDASTVVDVEGAYTAWLDRFGADAVLVRPDFYVFGAAAGLTASELAGLYLTRLGPRRSGTQV